MSVARSLRGWVGACSGIKIKGARSGVVHQKGAYLRGYLWVWASSRRGLLDSARPVHSTTVLPPAPPAPLGVRRCRLPDSFGRGGLLLYHLA